MTDATLISEIATRLEKAEADVKGIPPIAPELTAGDLGSAYAIQSELTRRSLAKGRRLVGRKVGLTSEAVQKQLGVNQPDYGALFADMEVLHDSTIAANTMIMPRIEAEIAVILKKGLPHADCTIAELIAAVDYAVPALEIVDSRIAEWKISILDTIADNGSSARYCLGLEPKRLTDLDLETCGMIMTADGAPVSLGSGAACLGHPLKAAHWLVRTMAQAGSPLAAGDVIMTGALGPMYTVQGGQRIEARIGGFSPVRVAFG
ncbi:MAG: fumarylacetoacetate hydrolase family protein [Phenylobacterium sp.]|uniref:2-keto-4-pentenoate hydratase n=1 Tax=Phenylobacterium sp. TaxID=1871053 RepID=UPI002733141D|nr:fumarylacetoacetate hydrolase family protein [Phenylobacterium sp.]MDP3175775.1 fumarylacetoacetate hydrolase family protein [Phenylobacterium sp.]